jgi:hypothetical protein
VLLSFSFTSRLASLLASLKACAIFIFVFVFSPSKLTSLACHICKIMFPYNFNTNCDCVYDSGPDFDQNSRFV